MRIHSLLFGLALVATGCADATETETVEKEAADTEALDALFADWDRDDAPGCAVAAKREGEALFSRAWGMADLEHDIANTPETLFEAGSVSKQFVAATVLLLDQEGKLSLDEDVREHIPELPDYNETITLRRLIHHTSGLRDWGQVAAISGWSRDQRTHDHDHVLDILSRQQALNFAPGAHYSYSNSGYNLLAVIVERVTGEPFADYSQELLFEPLGMDDTQWRDDYTRVVPGRSSAYSGEPGDDFFSINRPIEHVHGNGGLLTTVHDLLTWNQALTDGALGEELSARMQEPDVLANGREIHYAAGLQLDEDHGQSSIGHTGATSGYRAYLMRFPEQAVSVAMLCNVSGVDTREQGSDLSRIALGDAAEEPEKPPEPADVGKDVLEARAGLYADVRNHRPLELAVDGDKLIIPADPDNDDDEPEAVIPLSADRFLVPERDKELVFTSTDNERPGIRVRRDGYDEERLIPVTPADPSPETLADYTGDYASDEAETRLRIEVDDGQLYAKRRPADRFELEAIYPEAFEADDLGLLRFTRDDDGKVDGLSFSRGRVYGIRFQREDDG